MYNRKSLLSLLRFPIKQKKTVSSRKYRRAILIFFFLIHPFGNYNAENLFAVLVERKIGFMDRSGKLVVPPQFDDVTPIMYPFFEGLTRVYKAGKCGYIDEAGKAAIPVEYLECYPFREGLAVVVKGKSESPDCMEYRYLIDREGNTVFGPSTDFFGAISEGRIPIDRGGIRTCSGPMGTYSSGKFGYIDRSGKEILAPQYDYASHFQGGVATVRKGKYYGVINYDFSEMLPFEFDHIGLFNEGLTQVRRKEEWAVADTKGNIRIGFGKFHFIESFYDGVAQACLATENSSRECKRVLIDSEGRVLIHLRDLYVHNFSEGLAPAAKSNRSDVWGFIDKEGNWVIPPKFKAAYPFKKGLALVAVYDRKTFKDKFGYIDRSGKFVWQPSN